MPKLAWKRDAAQEFEMESDTSRMNPRTALLVTAALLSLSAGRALGAPDPVTGLPAYPNLLTAELDKTYRTEALGRWCARFTMTTGDSLATVETWYRKNLFRASETDLTNDDQFQRLAGLAGIKLALEFNYVAVYRSSLNPSTVIELHRCRWN
jgi:hypothetical protein